MDVLEAPCQLLCPIRVMGGHPSGELTCRGLRAGDVGRGRDCAGCGRQVACGGQRRLAVQRPKFLEHRVYSRSWTGSTVNLHSQPCGRTTDSTLLKPGLPPCGLGSFPNQLPLRRGRSRSLLTRKANDRGKTPLLYEMRKQPPNRKKLSHYPEATLASGPFSSPCLWP